MEAELTKSLNILKKGGIILYPTDTVWGIGCDATHIQAVEALFLLKNRATSKAMICLVSDFKMLNRYIEEVPEVAYDILKYATQPTTIVYERPLGIATNLIAPDNTLAFRVIREGFAHQLIKKLKRPLVSTSANISGEPTPANFDEISLHILNGVDYVVPLQSPKKNSKPSTIIKLKSNGEVTVIRK